MSGQLNGDLPNSSELDSCEGRDLCDDHASYGHLFHDPTPFTDPA